MPVEDLLRSGTAQAVPLMSITDPSQPREPQAESSQLDQSSVQGAWTDSLCVDPYFDYTTFAKPWNYHLDHTVDTSDWFSSQFFAAVRETGLAISPPLQMWHGDEYGLINADLERVVGSNDFAPLSAHSQSEGISDFPRITQPEHSIVLPSDGPAGRVSRVASPPNESSQEDQLPFAWDPRSRRIARAQPIILPADDPIFEKLDSAVAISQASLLRMKNFLRSRRSESDDDVFTLPDLPLINVFVGLFFSNFAVQAPVLHRPTLNVDSLPPALLTVIMIVGSCYSRLRYTRRFGIIVLDRLRQNLVASIEDDNSLMREPMIIYATALVCYMGIWCGNKRAFELSEALRAVVVTYIRRLPVDKHFQNHENHPGHQPTEYEHFGSTPGVKPTSKVQSQWLEWVTHETQKRLRWFVYTMDSQFPAILGMSGMFTLAEVRKWECPCDEAFWNVTTSRAWKNRLGSASEPSCPVFGSLTALLLSTTERTAEDKLLPVVGTWSTNLLMAALISEIFLYQDTLVVLRTYQDDAAVSQRCPNIKSRAGHLIAMLDVWHISYNQHESGRLDATSAHLQRCSTIMYYLARIYMDFPISDIQDCLGRSGAADAKAAMDRLGSWIVQCPESASLALQNATICISIILNNTGESDPYEIVGVFLCHVVIWSLAHAAPSHQKIFMLQLLRNNEAILPSIIEVIEAGFLQDNATEVMVPEAPQLVFRHAIQILVQQGTWGASANLALLLHLHPGVSR